jgi:hypothetical protein
MPTSDRMFRVLLHATPPAYGAMMVGRRVAAK